ncbi:MAG: hypothetical protein ACOH2N_04715 [Devosia sp.]
MAGEGDSERLVVLLEARIKDFEKNMAKASGTATKNYSGIRRSSKTATGAMEADMMRSTSSINRALAATSTRVGGFGKSMAMGFAAPLAGLLTLTAAINGAKAALDDFDKIAKNAKASGLDGQSFQEFAYAAELGGVATDEFAKSLETFNRNAGLAAVGKGKMITALKALNPELLKNILATQDQAERLKLAADAIDKAGSASEKAALATTLFGEAGTRMVEVLKGGRAALDQTAAAARDMGMVIDNDLLSRAEAMSDEFGTATKVMDIQFKSALINLAPILISTAQLAGNLAAAINYMTQSMQGLQDRSTARLEQDYLGLKATLDEANATMGAGYVGTMGVQIDPAKQAEMQAEADAMKAELTRRATAKLAADLNKPKLQNFETPGSSTTRNAAADATVKQAEAVKALIANLQHEQDQLGRNANEQEFYNALKSVGVTADSEFGQAITDTLGPLQEQRAAIEANAEMMSLLGDVGKSAVNGIINAMEDGKVTTEEWGAILSDVLGMAGQFFLNAAFGGLGGGGGFNIMSLFQGRETGGPVTAGVPYIVGEKRPEIFVPSQSGRIVPSVPTSSASATGSGEVSIAITNHISLSGSATEQDGAGLVRVVTKELRKQLPDALEQHRRNPLRRAS